NVRQRQYNGTGNGITDDHVPIQNAIIDACADGYPVFIPAGTYAIYSSIWLCYPGVNIIGAGRAQTTLSGNFPGFILYYPDNIGGYCCIFVGIESLGVKNTSTDLGAGAIQFSNMNPGSYIRDCVIRGMTGIDAQANMFTAAIIDCGDQ